jgi:hypothetical protein
MSPTRGTINVPNKRNKQCPQQEEQSMSPKRGTINVPNKRNNQCPQQEEQSMSPIRGTINVPILIFKQIGFTKEWKYLDLQFAFILNLKIFRNVARFIRLQGCGLCGVSGRQVCRFSSARVCACASVGVARTCVCARARRSRILKPGGEVHWEPPRDLSFSLQTLVIFTAKVSGSNVPLRRKKSTGCPGISPEIFQ